MSSADITTVIVQEADPIQIVISDGVPGPTGPQGPEGPEGPQGDQGNQGEQGIQGEPSQVQLGLVTRADVWRPDPFADGGDSVLTMDVVAPGGQVELSFHAVHRKPEPDMVEDDDGNWVYSQNIES